MPKAKLISARAKLMGSPFEVATYIGEDQSEGRIRSWLQLAFGEVQRIENLMTDFKDSPFNEINKQAGIRPVQVCREIFDLVSLSLKFSEASGGAFDISYASIGHLWREAKKKGLPPSADELEEARKFVNYRHIEMNPRRTEIFLPHRQMRIGLGGIGKGYAVDQAFSLLKGLGLQNLFVNGAGDIRVASSSSAPRPWRIAVRNPFSKTSTAMGVVELQKGAIATSGDYERYFEHQGKRYHHVIDARTGEITSGIVSATVLARTALEADVHATTLMILGKTEGADFLDIRRSLSGFMVTSDGDVIRSKQGLKFKESPLEPS